jgi:thiol-disulfide isomerase/thioredoxin
MALRLAATTKPITTARIVCFTIVLALTAGACASSSDSTGTSGDAKQPSSAESQPNAQSNPTTETAPGGAGAYISLSDYEASTDSYSESKVVLFFNATWCSTCKKARDNLDADLSAIPPDLVIVSVDFDSETDLKRQYGVTVQHTFVQIDVDGNEVAKWSGSLTAQEIAEKAI